MAGLFRSEAWPPAIPEYMLCGNCEDDKKQRAQNIVAHVLENELFQQRWDVKDKKVLDFGCGEGHVAHEFVNQGARAFGFDVHRFPWVSSDACILTADVEKIKAHAPFDFIVLYDVIDHCGDPMKELRLIRSLCGPKTQVFIRFHMWSSRHGGHLYRQVNKAWLHLLFAAEELELLGVSPDPTPHFFQSKLHQESVLDCCGFVRRSSEVYYSFVEDIFKQPPISTRFEALFPGLRFDKIISESFIDYILQPATASCELKRHGLLF